MNTAQYLRPEQPYLVPPLNHPVFRKQADQKDVEMIWFIVGAFRLAGVEDLTVEAIFGLIEKYQGWRIEASRGPKKGRSAKRNMKFILTRSPAFEHNGARQWHMTGKPIVRTKKLFQKLAMKSMTHEETREYSRYVDGVLGTV